MLERERVAQWFKVFQEEVAQDLTLPPQSDPTRPIRIETPN